MLSQDELYEFTGPVNESVQLSRTAVKRIFEENITYSPMEMDYKVRVPSIQFDRFVVTEYLTPLTSLVHPLTCTLMHLLVDFLGFATGPGVPCHCGEYELFLAHIGPRPDRSTVPRDHQVFLCW